MSKKFLAELVESMEQMNEIVRGERAPFREKSDQRLLGSASRRLWSCGWNSPA